MWSLIGSSVESESCSCLFHYYWHFDWSRCYYPDFESDWTGPESYFLCHVFWQGVYYFLEISDLSPSNSNLYKELLLGYMSLLILLMLDDDDPFFSALKNVSRWCFLCRFSVYCFKVKCLRLFWIRFKRRRSFQRSFSPHFPHHLCVKYCLSLRYAIRHVYLRRKVLNLKVIGGSPNFKKSRLSWRNHDYLEEIMTILKKLRLSWKNYDCLEEITTIMKKSRLSWRNHDYHEEITTILKKSWLFFENRDCVHKRFTKIHLCLDASL